MIENIDQEVLRHLLFHKAIAEYGDELGRIDRYIEILKKAQTGEHLFTEDPFDKSIAIVFELVLQKHLNPWAIDLAKFSELYLERAKKEKVDLAVAGRLIHMAWKVLNLQSRDAAENAEKLTREEEISWDDITDGDWMWDEQQDYGYTRMIPDEPPLVEPVRRKIERRVTLMELIEAFEKVREEVKEKQFLEEIRRKEKERILKEARKRMKGAVHEETLEADINRIWNRIQQFNGRLIPVTDICNFSDKNEKVSTIMALLHLAREGKIKLYQRNFPFGKIYIRKLN